MATPCFQPSSYKLLLMLGKSSKYPAVGPMQGVHLLTFAVLVPVQHDHTGLGLHACVPYFFLIVKRLHCSGGMPMYEVWC